jgi:hypothetical protein
MIALKWMLIAAGAAIFGSSATVVAYDVYLAMQFQRLMRPGESGAGEKTSARRPIRRPLGYLLAAR